MEEKEGNLLKEDEEDCHEKEIEKARGFQQKQ